jgi:transposase
MPAVPSCFLEPLWVQFSALLPQRQVSHRLGCHRPRIPDRVVFDKLVQMLRFGCSYREIADRTCSATTLRARRNEWLAAGAFQQLERIVLESYDSMIGLELSDLAVDGCITKAPCGGERAGRSPVDRGKQGIKRSTLTEAKGIPLGAVLASASRHDSVLLPSTLDKLVAWVPPEPPTVHLDRGYDYPKTEAELAARGLRGQVAKRGKPAPIQVGERWPVERTNSWVNNFRKLARCTERVPAVIELWLSLAHAIITLRRLIREAWVRYRWDARPSRCP